MDLLPSVLVVLCYQTNSPLAILGQYKVSFFFIFLYHFKQPIVYRISIFSKASQAPDESLFPQTEILDHISNGKKPFPAACINLGFESSKCFPSSVKLNKV